MKLVIKLNVVFNVLQYSLNRLSHNFTFVSYHCDTILFKDDKEMMVKNIKIIQEVLDEIQ